ncbi:DUF5696 domain-containing protein [Xanthobacter flavus]|uniref:DUF5696 domain-containing protein n=1 Tax=Xanthobacter flavus TaxID=281 RepID=UPI00372BD729
MAPARGFGLRSRLSRWPGGALLLASGLVLGAPAATAQKHAAQQGGVFRTAERCLAGDTVFERDPADASVVRFQRKAGGARLEWPAPSARLPSWSGTIGREGVRANAYGSRSSLDTTGPARFVSAAFEAHGTVPELLVAYDMAGAPPKLRLRVASCLDEGFVLEVEADAPLIRGLELSQPLASGTLVPLPFFPYPVHYDREQRRFGTAFADWEFSDANRLGPLKPRGPFYSELAAYYEPRTDETRNRVREAFVVGRSGKIANIFPKSTVARSPQATELIGRPVVDAWFEMPFGAHAAFIRRLRAAGMERCVYVLHIWQHQGYDNALLDHFPANELRGGDDKLKLAISTARQAGCLVMLHQNYLDYYPNYSAYSDLDIARTGDGKGVEAFRKREPVIQTFAARADRQDGASVAIARRIHELYGTDGVFHDVSGYYAPWRYADMKAAVPGGGTFRAYMDAHRRMLQSFRTERGPVLSEGQNSFYWIGAVDVAEAQFGAGYAGPGRDAPLLPQFALAVVHPARVNHGVGYTNRWADKPYRWDFLQSEADGDLYRMQQVVFGHQPYLGLVRNDSVTDPRVMRQAAKEWFLVGPLARRYGAAEAEAIQYLADGTWLALEEVLAGGLRPDVVRVTWSNGLTIVCNGSGAPVLVDGLELPPSGWSASAPGLKAYSATVNGHRVDYAEADNLVYFDGLGIETDFGAVRAVCDGWLKTEGEETVLMAGLDCAGREIRVRSEGRRVILSPSVQGTQTRVAGSSMERATDDVFAIAAAVKQ